MGNRRGATAAKGGGRGKAQEKEKRRFGGGAVKFTREVRGELKRVNWPNRDQLQQSTAVVVIIVVTLALYVAFWDFIFQYLARLIFT
jgi:preprotein translocase subunit SecE